MWIFSFSRHGVVCYKPFPQPNPVMKAKKSSRQDRSTDRKGRGLSGGKSRRKPVFALSREQVFRKCRAKKHRLIRAGEVLALMDLMEQRGWSILELAEHSHVSRQDDLGLFEPGTLSHERGGGPTGLSLWAGAV